MFNKDKLTGYAAGLITAILLCSSAAFAQSIEKTITAVYNNIKIIVNGEEIDDVHNSYVIYSESSPKEFYYSTDYSEKTGESTVWKYSNGKSTQVAEDVYFTSYTFCEVDGKYLALTDYEDNGGDLICISGDETYEVESDGCTRRFELQ